MKPVLLFLSVVFAGLALAACATLSEEECSAGDWRAIGISDGASGRPSSYLENHISACSEYGISIDRQLYENGRRTGLSQYCRLERAEAEGRDGDTYYGVCEGELGASFARVYEAAKALHALEARYNTAESELDTLIDQTANPDLSEEERQNLRLRADRLQLELRSLQNRISLAERRLYDIRRDEERRLSMLGISA